MKLEYKNDYQSIKKFDSIELPQFTILTGINGSGKTHLLKAIESGDAQIDSIEDTIDITYFDHIEFRVKNEGELNSFQLRQERKAVWDFFETSNLTKFGILKNQLKSIKSNSFPLIPDSEKIANISKQKNKPILSLTAEDVGEESLFEKLMNYKKRYKELFSHPELIKQQNLSSIIFISKKYNSFLDEIKFDEFMNLFEPIFLKENLLPIQIGRIFLEYRMKEFEEASSNFQKLNENTFEIKSKVKQKCTERYGGQTPWDVVNSFLNTFSNFDYEISHPDELDLDNYSNQEGLRFTPVLKDEKRNLSIPYSQLSGGEQILFSLALCLFKSKSDNMFPKLLLLDEIDATLHPSMIENLFNVIRELFIKNGTKVILATHSPTTIALAQEDTVYLVNKEGPNRIEKSDKKNALSILTQGFATIEEGIKLFDQLSKKEISIITEGKNTEHIKKAREFFAGNNKEKIDVIVGAESGSGDRQLKTIFDFFKLVDHDNKILFVWDCDANNYRTLPEENKTFRFVFKKNDANSLIPNGIENLFDAKYFQEFKKEITDEKGEIIQIEYHLDKEKFKNKILQEGQDEFKNFKPLFDYIDKILNSE